MTSHFRSDRGVTILEAAIILAATVILLGALTPSVTATVRLGALARAADDMASISTQALVMLDDVSYDAFTVNGAKNGTEAELLVSDGDTPREVSGTGSALWQAPVDNASGLVDFIERHLVTNTPRGSAANAYDPPGSSGVWRGAYLDGPIGPDPWGNRYAVNVEFLGNAPQDVVVLSAGPDEQIDTDYAVNGLAAGDDDLIVLVEP